MYVLRFNKRRGTNDEEEEEEESQGGFVLIVKLPFCSHLNWSCKEHMYLLSKNITPSLKKMFITYIEDTLFDFKLNETIYKIYYTLGGKV